MTATACGQKDEGYAERTRLQDLRWAMGQPTHNHVDGECCLDFSCCIPDLFERNDRKRWAYYHTKYSRDDVAAELVSDSDVDMELHMGWHRGHQMFLSELGRDWLYVDTGSKVSNDPKRTCGHCGLDDTPEGHDGCLGDLPGMRNACCGHGREQDAYLVTDDGIRLDGLEAMRTFCRLMDEPRHEGSWPWPD